MSAIVINKTVNLNATVRETLEDDLTFTGEKNAHKFVIAGIRNGSPVNLSGTVTAQFICPDNVTVPINGAIEGGKATVTLSDECYEVPGRFRLSIFNTDGGATVCIYSAVGTVRRTTTNRVVDRGTIPNLNELQQAAQNIAGVENIDITQTKSGNVITVTTTDRNNVKTNKTITEPTATMSKAENGDYTITVTDANGSTSYTIEDTETAVRKKATIEAVSRVKTALGNPLTITDGMDAPAVKTVVTLEPKQDLHGYDHPWVGGAGKNLLADTVALAKSRNTAGQWTGNTYTQNGVTFVLTSLDGVSINDITVSGEASADTYFRLDEARDDLPTETLIVSGTPIGSSVSSCSFTDAYSGRFNKSGTGDTTFTTNSRKIEPAIKVTSGAKITNLVFTPMIRLATETDATYEPYSNICPIEGYDTVRVTATGKNLYTGALKILSHSIDASGTYNYDSNGCVTEYISVKGADAIKWGVEVYPASRGRRLHAYDQYGNWLRQLDFFSSANDGNRLRTVTLTEDVAYVRLSLHVDDVYVFIYTDQSITGFIKDEGSTTSLSVAQAAGATVYGGTVTLNEDGSGTLVADRVYAEFDGSNDEAWIFAANDGPQYAYFRLTLGAINSVINHSEVSNAFMDENITGANTNSGVQVLNSTAYNSASLYVRLHEMSEYTTAGAFRSYLASNPLQIVYKSSTPTTYTLTADQLRTITGKNHVWTDGTKLELTYHADKYADVEKFLNAIPTGTKTGDPAVFADGADDLPFEKLTIAVEPHQEGSGDPSPDNVRPITGWDEVKVTRCGKNLFDPNVEDLTSFFGTVSRHGHKYTQTGQYTITIASEGPNTYYKVCKTDLSDFSSSAGFMISAGRTLNPTVAEGQMLFVYVEPSNVSKANKIFVALGKNVEYEDYIGSTLPISLKYATGSTVYGGTVTINRDGTGSVVVDRAKVDMGTLTWTYQTSATIQLFRASVTGIKTGGADMAKLSCPMYKWVPTSQRTNNTISQNYSTNVDVMDSRYTDAASFKSAMSGIPLIYELATPTTYTLTAPQLTSLLGNNTVWCDAGQVTVKYKRDIGKALDALEALILEN